MTVCDGCDGILYIVPVVKISSPSSRPSREREKLKKVQISEELFLALVKYHLVDMEEVLPEIKKGLMDKVDALIMHQLYTQYKTAPAEEEKEKAREKYLNKRGVRDSFRW